MLKIIKSKKQLQKKLYSFIVIVLMFCAGAQAQIQQNNIRVIDTTYTPVGYSGGPLPARLWLPGHPNGAGVVICHGAFMDYTQMHIWGDSLAAHGYVALSIDYYDFGFDSLPVLYPNPVREFKFGVEFLRRNAFKFGLYTGRIAAYGMSEGSMHWAQTIVWDNDDIFFGTDPTIDDHVDAAILQYGWYDFDNFQESWFNDDSTTALETWISGYFSPEPSMRNTRGNPIGNVANITSPILLFHGTVDPILQFEQSEEYRDSLLANNKQVELIEFPDDHAYDFVWDTVAESFDWNHFTPLGLVSKDSSLAFLERTLHPNEDICPLNKSYWRNHSSIWNTYVTPMMLGTKHAYNQSQLLSILTTASNNDASRKLANELIAAKLNLANGSDASLVRSIVIAADNIIGNRHIPITPKITTNSLQGIAMNVLSNLIHAFNSGAVNSGCNNDRLADNSYEESNFETVGDEISVFPNPLSPETSGSITISFSLSQSQNVSIGLFDLNGRLVKTLSDNMMEAGEHQWEFNREKLNAGIYFLRVQSEDIMEAQKLIIEN